MLKPPINMLGNLMHPWTMEQTVDEIERRIANDIFTQHVVINVAKLVNMRTDRVLRESVQCCDIINIDGTGVVWGARFLGLEVPERVAGVDLFFALLHLSERCKYPVYFLGAKQSIVETAVNKMRNLYPQLSIAGYHHGYFWENELEVIQLIKASGARLLFVAITSPKKEQFIARWRDQLGVDFAMGVGGTFDIVAGKTSRAPVWMQKIGMEWLYRLAQEPDRMWKRYLVTNSVFAWMLIKAKFSQAYKVK